MVRPGLPLVLCNLLVACLTGAAAWCQSLPEVESPDDEEVPLRPHGQLRLQSLTGGWRWQPRLAGGAGRWEGALLSERDPGEQDPFDHVAGYLRRTGRKVDATVGRLRPAAGQGLILGRGRSVGVPTATVRSGPGRPGTASAGESRALLGAAADVHGKIWSARFFVGVLRWDARLRDGVVVSLPDDGDHAGPGARVRQRLRGTGVGGHLRRTGTVTAGVTVLRLGFHRPLDLRDDERPAAFHGRQLHAVSVDAQGGGRHIRWAAAAARSGARHAAVLTVTGARVAGARLSLVARRYERGYPALLASAPTAAGMENESGATLRLRLGRLRIWADATRRPHPGWRAPTPGWRRRGGLHWERRGPLSVAAVYQGTRAFVRVGGVPGVDVTQRGRLRLRLGHERLRGTVQLDGSHSVRRSPAGEPSARGAAATAALRWRASRWRLDVQATVHRIEAWGARIYLYEPGLPGVPGIPALTGRQGRIAAVVGRQVGPLQLDLHLATAGGTAARFGLQAALYEPR